LCIPGFSSQRLKSMVPAETLHEGKGGTNCGKDKGLDGDDLAIGREDETTPTVLPHRN
jgi:hypothetical protein